MGKTAEPPKWIKPQLSRVVDEAPAGDENVGGTLFTTLARLTRCTFYVVAAIVPKFDRVGEFHANGRTHQKYRSRTSSVSPGRSTVPAPATTRTKWPFWSRRLM